MENSNNETEVTPVEETPVKENKPKKNLKWLWIAIALAVVAIVVSIILICVGLGDDSVKNEKDLDKTPISESNNTESEIDDTDTADKTDIVNDAYETIEKSGAVLKPVEVTSENSTENEGENSSSGTNVEDAGNNIAKETTGE